jgi:hypothetical protein
MKKAILAVGVLAILGMAATTARHGAPVVYANDGNAVGTWLVTDQCPQQQSENLFSKENIYETNP